MNFKKRFTSPFGQHILIPLFLVLITLAVYWKVQTHEFVHFSDYLFVVDNSHVNTGLSLDNIIWAFGIDEETNYWQPLSWLSHMLDCRLFGLDAGRHHLVSLLFHAANAALLFIMLTVLTGSVWRSFFAALLFSVHPVYVDAVAWLSDRKSLLSTLFLLLTIISYARYCRRPGPWRYSLVCILFTLGLMAKPTIMTLPFVLLLFDFWPLRRTGLAIEYGTGHASAGSAGMKDSRERPIFPPAALPMYKLIIEKIPFFTLSILSVFISGYSHTSRIIPFEHVPLDLRAANAVISYVKYLVKLVFPANLAFFYPYPTAMPPLWQVLASLALLVVITIACALLWRKRPYLIVGWLWFVGVLVPMSGIMQNGLWPALAGRWTYVPYIGLFIIIAWGLGDLLSGHSRIRLAVPFIVAGILAPATIYQLQFWKDDIILYSHAIEVTENNYVAHNNLGEALRLQGRLDESVRHFARTVTIRPGNADYRFNLARALEARGNLPEAIDQYRAALRIRPGFADAHRYLARALYKAGEYKEARYHFNEYLKLTTGAD
ncbi:MAG: tetratricopeptide repeat protein [Deltaproteobacteria bacterium]|nr:tetratricopeptide repeat protein [Deltaproteobacteria bacterium]